MNDKDMQRIKEEAAAHHIQTAHKINMATKVTIPKSLVLIENFDLRGVDSKLSSMSALPGFHTWVVFINKRCNLAHIMHRDDIYSYIRMRLPMSLKGCSESYLRKYFYFRMEGRYIV